MAKKVSSERFVPQSDILRDRILRSKFAFNGQILMFHANGRPVEDDDFDGQDVPCFAPGNGIAGWVTLNDGGSHGDSKVPYWCDPDKAVAAAESIFSANEGAGLSAEGIDMVFVEAYHAGGFGQKEIVHGHKLVKIVAGSPLDTA